MNIGVPCRKIDACILDGEMVGWDPDTDTFL